MIFVIRMSFITLLYVISMDNWMWIWISLYFNLIMLIALSSRESEFQYLYVSSRKQIENVYRCQFWNKFDSSILTMYVHCTYMPIFKCILIYFFQLNTILMNLNTSLEDSANNFNDSSNNIIDGYTRQKISFIISTICHISHCIQMF